MHHSSDIDNAMNNSIMVVDVLQQQKRRDYIYIIILSGYFYLQFLPRVLCLGYIMFPADAISSYLVKFKIIVLWLHKSYKEDSKDETSHTR